jgi:hypothetical protein
MEQAQLITPQGERISLPPHIFARMMEWLKVNFPPASTREEADEGDRFPPPMTREEIRAVIQETRGKYAGKDSMTEALLEMRAEERALERAKDAEITRQFFSKHVRKTGKPRVRAG